jgi:hypothetical protein
MYHDMMNMGTVTTGGGGSNLTLDDLTASPVAAYSVRKLDKDYTGYCMKVRRSSDNAEQDIGFSGNDLDTSSLATFCGSGSGFVVTWYDQSGNSRNATQSTSANQPRIFNSGTLETDGDTGGKASLYFNISILDASFTQTTGNACSLCLVANADENGGYGRIMSLRKGSGGNDFGSDQRILLLACFNSDETPQIFNSGGRAVASGTHFNKSMSLYGTRNGTTTRIYINNVSGTSNTGTSTTSWDIDLIRIGMNVTSNIGSEYIGHLMQVIVFMSEIDSTDRTTIYDDDVAYFGIN